MSAMATNTPPAPPVMALKPHIRPSQNVLWWETSACVHKHTHRDSRSDWHTFFSAGIIWSIMTWRWFLALFWTGEQRLRDGIDLLNLKWEDLGNRMEEKEREHWRHALQNNYLKITSVWKQPGLCLILDNIQTSMRYWDIACKTTNIWPAWKYQTSNIFYLIVYKYTLYNTHTQSAIAYLIIYYLFIYLLCGIISILPRWVKYYAV